MSDVLARICAATRAEVERRRRETPLEALRALASAAPPSRGFARALAAAVARGEPGLIAEIKKASPSKGLIRADFEPAALARAYRAGGASCLSVLTDGPYFQGCLDDLKAARAAVDLPVLRKDFMLDAYQIVESRAAGADCVLLIMAALDDATASALEAEAAGLGMDVLIEVHDEPELSRALRLRSPLIGVNNRDLKTLKVDLAVTERLAPRVPAGRDLVCESGLNAAGDLLRMRRVGAHRFLVGESLMRQPDVTAATVALLAGTRVAA
ncbi:MAG: indole-3-glycerol phosphate synthase TrpC [Alphaproteobacteria bacterium]|nr:indole-3-glycerol phosphate synthase TrpC [Alphaproteobacteria bacterium]